MRVRPADGVAGTVEPGTGTLVRVTLLTLAGALVLAALALFGYALAAARVPQHRATLENLVHAETGLDVRFRELRLRWGWYGPEAAFHAVELREPGDARVLLAAPQLVLGIDLWRMLRSGDLAVSRITLLDPDIDLTGAEAPGETRAVGGAAPVPWTRLLSRWRGTRIDLLGGRLRADTAGRPLVAAIQQMQLRRVGAQWSAEALLTLPESLGTSAHASLILQGTAARPADLAGTLTLSGSRLQLAGWRVLLRSAADAYCLPAAGSADLTVRIGFAHGAVTAAQGALEARSLAWPATCGPGAAPALDALRAEWQLARSGAGWHLAVEPLELGSGAPARAALTLEAAPDGSWVRGRVQRAPVAVLAALAARFLPQLRLSGLELAGTAREASFDWSDARPPGARLRTSAELVDLSLTSPGRALTLSGLTAHLSGVGSSLDSELHADSARLTSAADPAVALDSIGLSARIALDDSGRAWRVDARELEIRQQQARLSLSATLAGEDSGAHPRLEAHASLSGVPVALARRLAGPQVLAALGSAAGELTAGQIEHGELVARGPLDEPLPWGGPRAQLSGSLELVGASLAGGARWPDLEGLDALIEWRGARIRAKVEEASTGGLKVAAARAEWDARDGSLTRLTARLAGDTEQALRWLHRHPQLEAHAPGISALALRGPTLLDVSLRRAPRSTMRFSALLDGAELHPVAGLPGVQGLRGTLSFVDGHLQRSTLTGQWLGGPIALSVGERREHGTTALAISGRGQLNVRQAVLAATGVPDFDAPLQGNADWNADLRLLPGANGAPPTWRARAESSLVGVASALPEPFAKASAAALPLRIELLGAEDSAQLSVGLGERLRGLAAVKRRGDLWQIERGTVSFTAGAPVLPAVPVLRVEGSVSRLDLPASAALWRQLPRNPAWPALQVELVANELVAAGRSFAEVRLSADTSAGADQLRLESAELGAVLRWPAVVDADHPVSARIDRLDLDELAGGASAAASFAALGSATQLSIGDLRWQGRPLGTLTATVAAHAGTLEAGDVRLGGAGEEARGTLRCGAAVCRASFSLESHDAAATLLRLGFRPDLTASHATANGDFEWSAASTPGLAAAHGRLHLMLEDGVTRGAAREAAPGTALGLLAVPGLVAAMGLPALPFARLSADYTVADGQAETSDLHLDGETEIMMRGRIGLVAHDYAAQVWVLKGEERLPAAVRGLAPGARVAALWMSLRELFTGVDRERVRLRLHGTWDDPMVTVGD
jgi:uncharacterized protein YhdP